MGEELRGILRAATSAAIEADVALPQTQNPQFKI